MAARVIGPNGQDNFVPNDGDRQATATLLVGTAREYNIDVRAVRAVYGGFLISDELADILNDEAGSEAPSPVSGPQKFEDGCAAEHSPGSNPDCEMAPADDSDPEDVYDPADHTVAEVKGFVSDHPDLAADILASEMDGKARSSLMEWLDEFDTSGNRAVKNDGTLDKE